jgi:hypothetical protein
MNLQVIASPAGDVLWVSGPLPGAVHDLTAARIRGILAELATAGLITLADKGYQGADEAMTRTRGRTNRSRRKTRTGLTRNCVHPVNAPTPSLRSGGSSASSAAAPGAPDSSPKRSTCC